MRFLVSLMLLSLGIAPASGQITLTSEDFFVLGDSYTAMANERGLLVGVTGAIGMPGQNAWDFTTFSSLTPRLLIYDYVETSAGDFGGELLFPDAAFARRSTNDSFGVEGYIYISQDSIGQQVHGSYFPTLPAQPELIYMPPFIDHPFPLTFGQTWTVDTAYDLLLEVDRLGGIAIVIPTRNVFHTDATVDAFGSIALPGLGTLNGLRIHELVTQDVYADFFGTGNFEYLETFTTRAYIWVAEGADEVARITSQAFGRTFPPIGISPVDFTTASILHIQASHSSSTLNSPERSWR